MLGGMSIRTFTVRAAAPDDAAAIADVLNTAYAELAPIFPDISGASASDVQLWLQTGYAVLVAEREGAVHGTARYHDDEGITLLDVLAATAAGAGRALARAVEAGAQDRGIRLVRSRVPEDGGLPGYFGCRGYMPIARDAGLLVVERRLPLLTVREQRREDADAIGALTGEDPWIFEQGQRPGVFVAADGDRVVGIVAARDSASGVGRIDTPTLLRTYGGRGLDLWMVERAALFASTHGAHTVELPATPATAHLRKGLEDRGWYLDGGASDGVYLRRFRTPPGEFEEDL